MSSCFVRCFADLHLHDWNEGATIDPKLGVNTRLLGQVEAMRRLSSDPGRPAWATVSGDLVHSRGRLTPSVLWALREVLLALNSGFKLVVIIPGNHDYPLKDGVSWLHSLTSFVKASDLSRVLVISEPGVWSVPGSPAFYCLPWTQNLPDIYKGADDLAEYAETDKRPKILLSHLAIEGALAQPDFESPTGGSLERLHPELYDFTALGDFHPRQRLASRVYYIGSTMQHTRSEAGQEKGALDVDLVTGRVRVVPSGCLEFKTVTIATKQDIAEAKKAGPLVSVIVSRGASVSVEDARSAGLSAVAEPVERASDGGRRGAVKLSSSVEEIVKEYLAKVADPEDAERFSPLVWKAVKSARAGKTGRREAFLEVRKLRASWFMGYPSLEVDFLNRGIVFVDGVNEDDKSVLSNGAGKSTLIDAFIYAMTGKVLRRGLPVSEYRYRWAKRGDHPLVSLSVGLSDGRELGIERGTKAGLSLCLDGVPYSPPGRSGQELIEDLTGFDYKLLCRVVVFGQNSGVSFGAATDAERKEILSALCSGDRFDPALDRSRELSKDARDRRDNLRRSYDEKSAQLKAAIDFGERYLNKTLDRLGVTLEELEELESSDLDAVAARAARLASSHDSDIDCSRVEWEEAEARVVKASNPVEGVQELEEALADLEEEREEIVEKIRDVDRSRLIVKHDFDVNSRTLETVKKKKGAECPACFQKVTPEHVNELSGRMGALIKADKKRLAELNNKFDALCEERDEVTASINEIEEAIDILDADTGNLEDLRREARDKKAVYDSQLKLVERIKEELRDCIAQKEKAEKEVRRYRGEKKKIEEALEEVTSEVEGYAFAEFLFGNQGLRAFLFDSVSNDLTDAANKALRFLSDGNLTVYFGVEPNTKGQEKTVLVVDNSLGAACLAGDSGGESRKVEIAFAWAIHNAARGTVNLLFIDEAFDALDVVAGSRVAEFLSGYRGERGTILVTSHKPELGETFPKVWTVRKKNRVSILEGAEKYEPQEKPKRRRISV